MEFKYSNFMFQYKYALANIERIMPVAAHITASHCCTDLYFYGWVASALLPLNAVIWNGNRVFNNFPNP